MTDKPNHSEPKIYRNQPLNPHAVRRMLAWLAPHIPNRLRQEPTLDADIAFVPPAFEDIEDVFETLEYCLAQQQFLIEAACSLLMGHASPLAGQSIHPDESKASLPLTIETREQQESVPRVYWQVGFELSIMVFLNQLEHILWRIEEFLDFVLHTQQFDCSIESS